MATTDKAAWLRTVAETHDFGVRLADILRAGDLVLLSGPLGAGKTVLAQGIGAGLGVVGAITSPTFVIARVHRAGRAGRPAMVHVDAYRLGAVRDPRAEVDDLDLDESIDDAVTVVEWGEGVVEQLADAHLTVRIDRHDDEARTVTLEPSGGDWAQRIASIAGATSPAAFGAPFGAADASAEPLQSADASGAPTGAGDGYPRSATSAG